MYDNLSLLDIGSDGFLAVKSSPPRNSSPSRIHTKILHSDGVFNPLYSSSNFDGTSKEIKGTFQEAWDHLEDAYQNAITGIKNVGKSPEKKIRSPARRSPIGKRDLERTYNNSKRTLGDFNEKISRSSKALSRDIKKTTMDTKDSFNKKVVRVK